MNIKKYIPQELIEKSIDLTDILGVFELAWTYTDVMTVLKYLEENGILVLGGDVLDKKMSYTYDNWCYQDKNYIESIEYAKNYINNYYIKNGNEYYYVLVVTKID